MALWSALPTDQPSDLELVFSSVKWSNTSHLARAWSELHVALVPFPRQVLGMAGAGQAAVGTASVKWPSGCHTSQSSVPCPVHTLVSVQKLGRKAG